MEERFIIVKPESRKKLAERYKVSQASLSGALHFVRFSETARRIRRDAVNLYRGIPFM